MPTEILYTHRKNAGVHDGHEKEHPNQRVDRVLLDTSDGHRAEDRIDASISNQHRRCGQITHQPGADESTDHEAEHCDGKQIGCFFRRYTVPVVDGVIDEKRPHADLRCNVEKLRDQCPGKVRIRPERTGNASPIGVRALRLYFRQWSNGEHPHHQDDDEAQASISQHDRIDRKATQRNWWCKEQRPTNQRPYKHAKAVE
ncbi:hypothetical protein D3C84_829760 [compost metagenome]